MTMAFFAIVYLFLPSNNMSGDAVCYAADIKYGYELLHWHHLLYNGFMWLLYRPVEALGVSIGITAFICCINALFSLSTLAVLYATIKRIASEQTALALTVFAGSCFGFLRYTLESEVYIPPLFFSIVSSYFFVRYSTENRLSQLLFMALAASLACLFHQIHLFWGIALFIGIAFLKRYRDLCIYAAVTLIVPATYALVVFLQDGYLTFDNFSHYIAYYYYTPASDVSGIGLKNLIMSPISFVRSFIQLHGDIAIQLSLKPYLYVLAVVLPIAAIYLLVRLVRSSSARRDGNRAVIIAHLAAFLLQLLFAIYSDGNTEFMVMLPFALVIMLSQCCNLSNRYVVWLASVMLAWNLTFSVLPNHFYNQYATDKFSEYVHEHPDAEFVAYDAGSVQALCFLKYGEPEIDNVFYLCDVSDGEFITDIIDRPTPFNRMRFVKDIQKNYIVLDTLQTIEADYGNYHLCKIRVR